MAAVRRKVPILRKEVHLFSGLGDGLLGIDRGVRALESLIDALPYEVDARMWRYRQWEKVSDEIIQRHLALPTRDDPVVALIGHSKGAQSIINVANRLRSYKIEVDLLVAIDPTALLPGEEPMKVPGNVRDVLEFWSDRGLFNWPLRMRKKFPDGQFGGKLVPGNSSPVVLPAGHIPVASHPTLQRMVVNSVRRLIRDAEREAEKENRT